LEDFCFAINEVKKSFIRVGSDEVTYNLHILLRFEIERALISGQLQAREVPDAWNARFKELFDLTPPGDREGCLQDVHWGRGAFGYFPSYALGNIYAAQLFAQAKKEMPDMENQFGKGQFDSLLHWLRERVHSTGQKYRAAQLVRRITNQPPHPQALLTHLKSKYGQLYEIH
jgi:carboxypeptidase Taq